MRLLLMLPAVLISSMTVVYADEDASSEIPNIVAYAQVDSFEKLDDLASETADKAFVPRAPIPEPLAALKYSDYVKISYKNPSAKWWGSGKPFWLETFHQGFVQRDRVMLFANENGVNHWIPFSTDDFLYGLSDFDPVSIAGAGHAGIKIAGRFPTGAEQEILTFLGSSYFRGRSEANVYGASARGLAIDVATEGAEEFPFYRAFWVNQPKPNDKSVTILALLDSPSVAGAYRFILTPGTTKTNIAVTSSLHFRRVPGKVGIAPLTSMWIWGDGLRGPKKDLRPSVHDSDGLLIRTKTGQKKSDWTWRAFSRPPYPSVTSFATDQLLGFGLMQRNTSFFHFDDHNAQYQKRPSVFVTPKGDWGHGRIELLEMPGAHEGIDNIGAYWIADEPPTVGKPMNFEYDVDFFSGDHGDQSDVARATAFEIDRGDETIDLTIRFSGQKISLLEPTAKIEPALATIRGEVVSRKLKKTETGDWLLKLELKPAEKAPMELKATLRLDGETLSETFAYLLPHEEPTFVYPDVYTR